jgi:hypothetical protein
MFVGLVVSRVSCQSARVARYLYKNSCQNIQLTRIRFGPVSHATEGNHPAERDRKLTMTDGIMPCSFSLSSFVLLDD